MGIALQGITKIGAVDGDNKDNASLSSNFYIRGFPTLKIFVNGKPTDYSGARTSAAMKDAVVAAISKAKGGADSSSSSSGSEKKTSSGSAGSAGSLEIEVTDSNFDQLVYQNELPTFLFF